MITYAEHDELRGALYVLVNRSDPHSGRFTEAEWMLDADATDENRALDNAGEDRAWYKVEHAVVNDFPA